jgi:protease-4
MSNLPPAPHAPASRGPGFFGCAFALSFFLNVAAAGVFCVGCLGLLTRMSIPAESAALREETYAGSATASHKIAIVEIDGVILESLLGNVHKQIEQAAKDDNVSAVVLRVNSPGGSLTASDDLHQRIVKLRDGHAGRPAKPLVVSMGGVAASGGYYISVPASKVFAEPTTTTGSIGVYSAFPNVAAMGEKFGFTMNTIKAGEIKDAASMFRPLEPKERQVLQDMVDEAYVQFLTVVSQGRKKLTRKKLLERFPVTPLRPDPRAEKQAPLYSRYRADGGTFSARQAKELDLVDAVGTLDDAVTDAAAQAQLTDYRAVRYQKPFSLNSLLGVRAPAAPAGGLDAQLRRASLAPRLWCLAPGYEAAGLLGAGPPAP